MIRINRRRGAATVEFALVAPVFLLLLMGIFEYGRMVMVQQMLVAASREGARTAIVQGSTVENIKTAVDTYLRRGGISGAALKVSTPNTTAIHGDPVAVTVSIPFAAVSWLPSPFFLGDTTLSATAVMRHESPE